MCFCKQVLAFWPKDAITKAQGDWSLGRRIAGPPLALGHHPCLGTAWAVHRRSSQGHRHGYSNYILDEIPKFPFIYIPTLPSSFPLFVPRISTDFTGNSMKAIRSPLRLTSKTAGPDDGRRGTPGSSLFWLEATVRPWQGFSPWRPPCLHL